MRRLLLFCALTAVVQGFVGARPLEVHVVPDDPTLFDPVVLVLVSSRNTCATSVDSVYCSRIAPGRLEVGVLLTTNDDIGPTETTPYAESCVFGTLPIGQYTGVAKIFVDDLSAPPAFTDSLSFSVRPPVATRPSTWGYVRSLFR